MSNHGVGTPERWNEFLSCFVLAVAWSLGRHWLTLSRSMTAGLQRLSVER